MAPVVVDTLNTASATGLVADLFAGVGAVATACASRRSVVVNDIQEFAVGLARARFTSYHSRPPSELLEALRPDFAECFKALEHRFNAEVVAERLATASNNKLLLRFILAQRHIGNDEFQREQARVAARADGFDRYVLASLYFRSSYFSVRQAMELDALRYAIDRVASHSEREYLVAAWISAAGAVVNAPGHTAQFLKPTTPEASRRVKRSWTRSAWSVFEERLEVVEPVGTRAWRARNRVSCGDAVEAVGKRNFHGVGVVYADPPYTKDHYSRFYHLYETLYRYDYPDSTGAGRYRSERFSSAFSVGSRVESAFARLAAAVAERDVPLVLSYPTDGLLYRQGTAVEDVVSPWLRVRSVRRVDIHHSTMGGSSGTATKIAHEQLFTLVPT